MYVQSLYSFGFWTLAYDGSHIGVGPCQRFAVAGVASETQKAHLLLLLEDVPELFNNEAFLFGETPAGAGMPYLPPSTPWVHSRGTEKGGSWCGRTGITECNAVPVIPCVAPVGSTNLLLMKPRLTRMPVGAAGWRMSQCSSLGLTTVSWL